MLLTFITLSFLCFATLCFADGNQGNQNPQVVLKTSAGDITLELYPDKAPVTVENFLQYVKNGHYKDTIFHRVIDGFMIQGGGFTREMDQKPTGSPIKNEANNDLSNTTGTIAMARTSVIDSATSQFFINVSDNHFLDYRGSTPSEYGYCVFGKVVNGMDSVVKIKDSKTTNIGPHQNLPVDPVLITEAVILN